MVKGQILTLTLRNLHSPGVGLHVDMTAHFPHTCALNVNEMIFVVRYPRINRESLLPVAKSACELNDS